MSTATPVGESLQERFFFFVDVDNASQHSACFTFGRLRRMLFLAIGGGRCRIDNVAFTLIASSKMIMHAFCRDQPISSQWEVQRVVTGVVTGERPSCHGCSTAGCPGLCFMPAPCDAAMDAAISLCALQCYLDANGNSLTTTQFHCFIREGDVRNAVRFAQYVGVHFEL